MTFLETPEFDGLTNVAGKPWIRAPPGFSPCRLFRPPESGCEIRKASKMWPYLAAPHLEITVRNAKNPLGMNNETQTKSRAHFVSWAKGPVCKFQVSNPISMCQVQQFLFCLWEMTRTSSTVFVFPVTCTKKLTMTPFYHGTRGKQNGFH